MGIKFWGWIMGMTVLAGLALVVMFAIFGAAWRTWGIFGAMFFFIAVLLGIAWVFDRRKQRQYEAL